MASVTVSAFGIGAALLAMWLTVRFPKLAPTRGVLVVLHLLLAAIVAEVGLPAGLNYLVAHVSAFSALLLVALPTLIYLFLSAMWVIQWAQHKMSGGGPSGGHLSRV